MPQKTYWSYDENHRIYRAHFSERTALLVADRSDGSFDCLVVDPESGETLWEPQRSYPTTNGAKLAVIAAAKRMIGVPRKSPKTAKVSLDPTPQEPEIEIIEEDAGSVWRDEGGRHVAAFTRTWKSVGCAIIALDPGHYRGFIRLGPVALSDDYSSLLEAKRALATRADTFLDQWLPDGMYAGGI